MYRFGRNSRKQKRTLYPWLQLILTRTLLRHDLGIRQGGRSDREQWDFYESGTSTLLPPEGKHLLREDPSGDFDGLWSFAADVLPYINNRKLVTDEKGFGPNQKAQFAYFLALLLAEAKVALEGTGWQLRLGINWDMDAEILTDQKFDDWFHVELVWVGR